MFLNLLRFELKYHGRQPLFLVAAALFLLVGLGMSRLPPLGGTAADAPTHLGFLVALLSLNALVPAALFCGAAVLRDRENGMAAILFTTQLTHAHYVISRFFGLLAASCGVLSLAVAGLYVGGFVPSAAATQTTASPLPHLWALIVFGWPNLVLGCAMVFASALLTRSTLATYLSGVGLYVVYWVSSVLGNSPLMAGSSLSAGSAGALALLEPFGLVAMLDQIRGWSLAERNAQYLALEGVFLLNRLLWLATGIGVFALAYRLFDFRVLPQDRPSPRAGTAAEVNLDPFPTPAGLATPPQRTPPQRTPQQRHVQRGHRATGWRRSVAQTRAMAGLASRVVLGGYASYLGLALWTLLIAITVHDAFRGDLRAQLEPLTALILPDLLEPLLKLGGLMVVFFSSELTWLARTHRIDSLVSSCPTTPATLLGARLVALGLGIAVLITVTLVVAIPLHFAFFRPATLDWGLYFSLYWRAGIPLLALGALALTLQSFFENKYLGLGASFAVALLGTNVLSRSPLGLESPLWRFGFTPPLELSTMAATAYHDPATFQFLGYWMAWAAVMLAIALACWRRGADRRFEQWRLAGGLGVLGLAAALWLGFSIHQHLRPLDYSRKYRLDWQERYERAYGSWAGDASPTVVGVSFELELFPEERRLELRGDLVLENQEAAPLSRLLVAVAPAVRRHQIQIEGAESEGQVDVFGHRWYRLAEPMAAGARRRLRFELEVESSPFSPMDAENYVLPHTSYVEVDKLFPRLGFQRDWIVEDPLERASRQLGPMPALAAPAPADRASFDAVIGTARGQAIVTVGELVESWEKGARSYYRFHSPRPLAPRYGVSSAQYQVLERSSDGVRLSVWADPAQTEKAESILDAAEHSLAYFRQHFGPYPDAELKIAEIPAFSDLFGATAYPNTLFAVENRVFLVQKDQTLDLPFRSIAHEVSHQYWAHQLEPKPGPGDRLLTEVLAEYSAMVAHENVAPASRLPFQAAYQELYFFLRGFHRGVEPPLARVGDEPFVYYFKGAHALHVAREAMGEERVNQILRGLLTSFPYPSQPEGQVLVDQLLEACVGLPCENLRDALTRVVTYDLSLELESLGEPANTPRATATLALRATRRWLEGEDGSAHQQAYAGLVELGLFQGENLVEIRPLNLLGQPLEKVELELPAGVDRLVLDPRYLLLVADRTAASRNLAE